MIEQDKTFEIAAFCTKEKEGANVLVGGNPAGVQLVKEFPSDQEMLAIAKQLGHSETVFAVPLFVDNSVATTKHFRVRYFSPLAEVPFCGHATIALGAALAMEFGNGEYKLNLNDAIITVVGSCDIDPSGQQNLTAQLVSPLTHSRKLPLSTPILTDALALFNIDRSILNMDIPPAIIHGGSNHLVLCVNSEADLAQMSYDFLSGKAYMVEHELVTILWVWAKSNVEFKVRNAFAIGGVVEDPATGAAAAAFCGYLRDLNWPTSEQKVFYQGGYIDMPSKITAKYSDEPSSPITLIGQARLLS